jgi:hypothetical protein
MKRSILFFVVLLINCVGFSQETNKKVKDSVASEPKLTAAIDVVYPYLWRGIRYYGNKVAFQPYVEYAFTDKLSFELWATTNFSNAKDAYNEFDWTIYYQVSPIVNISLSDYYWPATAKNMDWEKSNYFDYSVGSAQTLDLSISLDFTENGVPIDFLWSTLIGGNDYNYDDDGNATTRAFSSYAEVGYTHTLKKSEIDIRPFVGAAIINGGYYGNKTDGSAGFSFTNVGVDITKEFTISENYGLPVFIRYTNNNYGVQEFDSEDNLTRTVRNFFSFGLTFTLLK